MNATTEAPETTEMAEPQIEIAEQARIITALLKEYADKLSVLNTDLISVLADYDQTTAKRAAWLLDQVELLRKPLSNIISRGSALLEYSSPEAATELRKVAPLRENSVLTSLAADELTLRMREIEIHHHHMLRLAHELRQALEHNRVADQVKKLRLAAGLNAMKGGPLDPN